MSLTAHEQLAIIAEHANRALLEMGKVQDELSAWRKVNRRFRPRALADATTELARGRTRAAIAVATLRIVSR